MLTYYQVTASTHTMGASYHVHAATDRAASDIARATFVRRLKRLKKFSARTGILVNINLKDTRLKFKDAGCRTIRAWG